MNAGRVSKPLIFSLAGITVVLLAGAVGASVPVGVYGVIEEAVFEPTSGAPQRIRLGGAFAVWDSSTEPRYRPAERGHLYYTCPPALLETCRNEWRDLASLAGTGQAVGFGSRSLDNGRLRRAGDPVAAPDRYPIQFGVVKLGAPRGPFFAELRNLARAR